MLVMLMLWAPDTAAITIKLSKTRLQKTLCHNPDHHAAAGANYEDGTKSMKQCHLRITATRDHRHMSGLLDCFRTCSLDGTHHLKRRTAAHEKSSCCLERGR